MAMAFDDKFWDNFFHRTKGLAKSLHIDKGDVSHGCMYSRVEALRSFFDDMTSRNLLSEREKKAVVSMKENFLNRLIDQLNKKRVVQMANCKLERMEQEISPELAANYSIYLDELVKNASMVLSSLAF